MKDDIKRIIMEIESVKKGLEYDINIAINLANYAKRDKRYKEHAKQTERYTRLQEEYNYLDVIQNDLRRVIERKNTI